jgi:hypothetical protein
LEADPITGGHTDVTASVGQVDITWIERDRHPRIGFIDPEFDGNGGRGCRCGGQPETQVSKDTRDQPVVLHPHLGIAVGSEERHIGGRACPNGDVLTTEDDVGIRH